MSIMAIDNKAGHLSVARFIVENVAQFPPQRKGKSNTRWMNTAICPRLTLPSGQ